MNPQFDANNVNNHIVSTETKEEPQDSSDIQPFEVEDGRRPPYAKTAAAGATTGAATTSSYHDEKAPQRGVCARHKGKFICLGITLSLLLAAAIAIPLLMPKDPTATLLEQSNLRVDGLGTGGVAIDLRMKIDNPNRYAIAFQNLKLDVYDFNGAHIGEVTRAGRFRVPGRSSGLMNATAFMQPSFFEILAMGLNCLQNDNLTKLKIRGTAEARFAGKTMRQEVGPFDQLTQCIATNINGQVAPPPPGVAPAGVGNGQIIQGIGQAINNGINNIFGGAGGAGGAGAAPAPGAVPAPGAAGARAAPVVPRAPLAAQP